MEEFNGEVYLDDVKLEPTGRGIIPVGGHNTAPFDEYHFTILGHPVCIAISGASRVRLETESFEKFWIDEGYLRFKEPGVEYELEELVSTPGEMVAFLKVHNAILTDCVFYCTGEVEGTWLERCQIVCSTITHCTNNDSPSIQDVSFYKSDVRDCRLNSEGAFQKSIMANVDITCAGLGSFEICECVCGDSKLYGRVMSLIHMSIDDSDLFSEAGMVLGGFNIEHLTAAAPVLRLRSKFDYFKIELNKCTLVVIRDGTRDDNFFVSIEESGLQGTATYEAAYFAAWLEAELTSRGEYKVTSLVDYVKQCIESRLNLLKTLEL